MGSRKHTWYKVAENETGIKLSAGDVGEVDVNGKKVCVGRSPEGWFGFAHVCPHAGAPMTDGYMAAGCQVVCPVHQLKFNLKNGRDVNGEGYSLKIYPVEIRPDGVYVGLEEGGGGLFKKWF